MGILTGIGMLIVLLVMIDLNFLWLFGKSPSMFNIKEPIQHIASEIYSADGKLIGNSIQKPYTGGIQGYFSDTGQDAGLHGGRTLLQAFRYRL